MTKEMTNQDASRLIDEYIKVLQPLTKEKLKMALEKLSKMYDVSFDVLRNECARRRAF